MIKRPSSGNTFSQRLGSIDDRRWIEIISVGFFAWYGIYVLMLGKFFSPVVTPDWYRDLGLLWDLADDAVRRGHYLVGQYFFPPSSAIIVHLYGLIDRDLAFRLFLLAEVAAVGLTMWAWLRLIGIAADRNRALVLLAAFFTTHTYIHFELQMHNANAMALAMVSLALAFQPRVGFSTGCYVFSLVVKPYSSCLILPWMVWHRDGRWAASALCWLVLWFGALPVIWFGATESVQLYREWIASLIAIVTNDDPRQLSIRAGVAALAQWDFSDARVEWTARALQATWILALAAFFVPSLRRRRTSCGIPAACDFAAILMIGLPLGNHQQPARGIVLLASALVIASAIFDPRQSPRRRSVLGGLLLAIGVSSHAVPMGPLHFLLTLPICMLSLLGLAVVRAMPTGSKTA